MALILANNFPSGWSATFKLNLTRFFHYFAFHQFTWALHAPKHFGFGNGERNTLPIHNSYYFPPFQASRTRVYWWGEYLYLLYFYQFWRILLYLRHSLSVALVLMLILRKRSRHNLRKEELFCTKFKKNSEQQKKCQSCLHWFLVAEKEANKKTFYRAWPLLNPFRRWHITCTLFHCHLGSDNIDRPFGFFSRFSKVED